ncbi:MAG TPA: cytochrome P450 [Acidimicrobiales bacterium]|jgi:cytochrome P450
MPSSSAQQAFDRTVGGTRDPWTRLATLRRDDGVVEGDIVPDAGAGTDRSGRRFAVLRYDDCAGVLRDSVTFSSRVYERVMGPVMGHTILEMDDPEHGRFRRLAGHAFRHKALERWESELVEPLAQETIAAFAGRGHAELVRELTFPFPVQVIARILGLPRGDYPMFQELAFTLTSVGAGYRASRQASDQLGAYLLPIVRDRRARPADDLISELAAAEMDGEALCDEEIVSYLRLLLPAGSETTYCSIGNLLFALLTHRDQLEDVRGDSALMPRAIEELFRWEPAIPFIPRVATRDVSIAEVPIPAGARVTVCLGSANRDETRFIEPDRFDIHRPEQQQLAFASGPHMCLGMHLARMEMRVVLAAILDRLPDIELAPGPDGSDTADPHIHGLGFRKPTSVPVRFTPQP